MPSGTAALSLPDAGILDGVVYLKRLSETLVVYQYTTIHDLSVLLT